MIKPCILAPMGMFKETKRQVTDTRDAVLQTAEDMQDIAKSARDTLAVVAVVALAALLVASLALIKASR